MNAALTSRERWSHLSLAALVGLVWLSTLAMRPLFNPDEGRYAEIPREMLSSGDWIIPHLNGLAYIEKPPLQYWATALSLQVFGPTAFAARLYTTLCAFGTLACVWLVARRHGGEVSAWMAGTVLAGMALFLTLGQLLTLDMSLTFYMTVSLGSFLLAQQAAPGSERRWMLLAWAAAALAVLTKGVVAAAIPAAVLVLYSLAARDVAVWRRLNVAGGLPLFLVITVPWHWLAAQRLPDFLQFFFVHEHLARYLTPEADRQEPGWYFAVVFVLGTLPWTWSALRVLVTGWRPRTPRGTFNPQLFLWIWVVFIGVFFSLSDSKLIPYILPALPALSLLIAAQPADALKRDVTVTTWLTFIGAAAAALVGVNAPRLLQHSDRAAMFLQLAHPLEFVALLLAVSGAYVLVRCARDTPRAVLFLGAGWCLAWLLILRAAALVAPIYSGVDLAAAVPIAARDAPVYSLQDYDQTLPFYLQRPVTLVGYRGELDYGLRQKPSAAIADLSEFVAVWTAQSTAFAVMRKSLFEELKTRGVPMTVVGQSAEKIVVGRR